MSGHKGPLVHRVSGQVGASGALTVLLLVAALITAAPAVITATTPPQVPPLVAVLLPTPSTLPPARVTQEPTHTLSNLAASTPGSTPAPTNTATLTPSQTSNPTSSSTPTPAPSSTATLTSSPARTPPPSETHTATAAPAVTASLEYVSAAYAETTLGQAVIRYNATRSHRITMHVVSRDSQGVDAEMYRDLVQRGWRIMGPEDFAASAEKSGWPYVVIALEGTLNANSVVGWGYVLDHELVHMVAAANLATEGLNLAKLMRRTDGTFTPVAHFHEVCADFYPRDPQGNHRPVARFYGAMDKMPELLRILETYDAEVVEHDPPTNYEVLAITGIPLVDAACVWDRSAIEIVIRLYEKEKGPGAFSILFPSY